MEDSKATREARYQAIKAYYDTKDREAARRGKLPLGSTEKGFWGVAHLDDIYAWCERVDLAKQGRFIDLGSGDGRVVLVAALFTDASGVEYDAALHAQALAAARALGSDAHFMQADYTALDLSRYPVWFSYADHNFAWLEEKKHELTALYLYHDTFHPEGLHKGKITWIGQIPIFCYTRESPSAE